jgi:putative redox protein
LFDAAKHPKSFISLDQADHLLKTPEDAAFVAQVIAARSCRYIRVPETTLYPGERVTVSELNRHYAQDVLVGNHHLRAGEPIRVGGDDHGPTPYEFLLAGLGACTSITLRMYAERKQWPLEGVRVHLSHEKIHASDCEGCETASGQVDHIDRTVVLEGPLDDEQRARLLEIADKCPVHRTLRSEVSITTHLKEPERPSKTDDE